MRTWETTPGLGPKLCMASRAFKRDKLRILLSDFDKGQKQTSLGTKEMPCVIGMSIVIMGAEHSQRISADLLSVCLDCSFAEA